MHHTQARGACGGRENEFVGCSQLVVGAHKFGLPRTPSGVDVLLRCPWWVASPLFAVGVCVSSFSVSLAVAVALPLAWPSWAVNVAGGQPNSQFARWVRAGHCG